MSGGPRRPDPVGAERGPETGGPTARKSLRNNAGLRLRAGAPVGWLGAENFAGAHPPFITNADGWTSFVVPPITPGVAPPHIIRSEVHRALVQRLLTQRRGAGTRGRHPGGRCRGARLPDRVIGTNRPRECHVRARFAIFIPLGRCPTRRTRLKSNRTVGAPRPRDGPKIKRSTDGNRTG